MRGAIIGSCPSLRSPAHMSRRCGGPARRWHCEWDLPRDPVPDDGGFPLIGDADRGDLLRRMPASAHGRPHGRERARPDCFRIVLDPAGRGIELREFLLRARDRRERPHRTRMARVEVVP